MTNKQKLLLLGIVVVTLFFRFYMIKEMPGGLFPDEAANGLDVNLMQQGHLQPFYERNNGREGLFFYMLWGSVELFGKGPWQHHIVSAGVGTISVLLCFLVARKLFELFALDEAERKRAITLALWAAFFMAASTWHLTLSRTAFRAILIPMFAALTFYFLLLAVDAQARNRRLLWSALTGIAFGLGFYTYIAYRIMVPIMVPLILWPLLVDVFAKPRFMQIKKYFAPAMLFIVISIATVAPLTYYFYTHPGSFLGRSSQVSLFNPDINGGNLIGTINEVAKQSMLGFFLHGDLNWRHNVSGYPFLSILVSPFFALGLVLVTFYAIRYALMPRKYKLDWKYFLLTGWFWGMLIPEVTTAEGIPHGLRSIGTIPSVFIISAFGLMTVVKITTKVIAPYWPYITGWKKQILTFAFGVKTVAYILAILLQSYFAYFIFTANSPESYYYFRSDLTTVSDYLKINGSKTNTYLVLDGYSDITVQYLTIIDARHPDNPENQPYTRIDPEDAWQIPGLKHGDKIIFAESDLLDLPKFKQYNPDAKLDLESRNKFNQTVMVVYKIK